MLKISAVIELQIMQQQVHLLPRQLHPIPLSLSAHDYLTLCQLNCFLEISFNLVTAVALSIEDPVCGIQHFDERSVIDFAVAIQLFLEVCQLRQCSIIVIAFE